MPLVEDLQPFIADLNSLGHEPEILAMNGESIETIVIPPEGLPKELESLLQSSSPPSVHGEAANESSLPSAEEGLDFDSVPAADYGGSADSGFSGETEEDASGGFEAAGLPNGLDDDEAFPEAGGGEDVSEPPADDTDGVDLEALLADFEIPGDSSPEENAGEETPPAMPEDDSASFGEEDGALAGFPDADAGDGGDLSGEDAGAAPAEETEPDEDPFALPETDDAFTISDMGDSPPSPSPAAAGKTADSSPGDFPISGADGEDFPEADTLPEISGEAGGDTEEEAAPLSGELEELLADFPDADSASGEEPSGAASAEEGAADDFNLDDFQMSDFSEDAEEEPADIPREDGFPGDGETADAEDGADETLPELEDAEELPEEESDSMDSTLSDDFNLEDGIELPGEEGPEDGMPDEDLPSGGEEITGNETASHDEFNLNDFGEEFGGAPEEAPAARDETEINIPEGASNVIDSAAAAGAVFALKDAEFAAMQETLQSLPLNIKIVVEELIGDQKVDDAAQMNLIRMLVKGASVKSVAAAAGKLAGRTLAIPKGYAKSSGTAWEAEKGSLAYFLRETFWPVFKVASAGLLAAGILVFLGYSFIYKPIHAHILLSRGYEMIQEDRFRDGNSLFTEGYNEWPFKEWYFDYARTFIEKKQYRLAREKYEQLLSEYDDYLDGKGIRREREKDEDFVRAACEYAHFESVLLENFEGAEKIIQRLLAADMYNYDGLLEAGDNYIRWAEYDEARFADKYEEARKAYAIAMGAHGESDEILFRFLDVFMHMDNKQEVLRIKSFFQANPDKAVDPVRYAELGGYLLDKNESIGDVRNILFRALEADKTVPGVHYHLARFAGKQDEPRDERLALDNAIHLYTTTQPVNRKGLWRLVDSYGRSGELFVKQKSFLEAEGEFKKGIERYEDGVKKTILKNDAALGRLYSRLGDIYYYQSGDLEAAYDEFAKAEASLVSDPALSYKKGYIRYTQEDYADALREFAAAEEAFPSSRNLLFALGNANYMRSNFSVAEGYYSFLTENLEADKRRIGELIPDSRSSDRAMVLNLVKAYNNLGVILHKMGERTGSAENTSRAMVLWTASTELAANYARESETMLRRDTKDIAYLNLRQILNPLPGYEPQIYRRLPMDMNELFFSTELQ